MPEFGDGNIVQIASEYQRDLLWSLQPIFTAMRFLGIDLDVGPPRSKLRRTGFILTGILMISYIEAANIVIFLTVEGEEAPGTVAFWCRVLKRNVRLASSLLLQLAVFFMAHFKWKLLWKKVEPVQHFISVRTFGKLRKLCLFLIVIISIMVTNKQQAILRPVPSLPTPILIIEFAARKSLAWPAAGSAASWWRS